MSDPEAAADIDRTRNESTRVPNWCARWSNEHFVRAYDELYDVRTRNTFYTDLAGSEPKQVLDLGCGTGRLACDFASAGHRVVGVDPAALMLDVACERPFSDTVTWLPGTIQDTPDDMTFDLVIMTGHIFQLFWTDAQVDATLRAVRHHLGERGLFAFEVRNPSARAWTHWNPEPSAAATMPDGDTVSFQRQLRSETGEYVTYDEYIRSGETVDVSTNTMRVMPVYDIERHLTAAGLTISSRYGDWDRSPASSTSPEVIFISTPIRSDEQP